MKNETLCKLNAANAPARLKKLLATIEVLENSSEHVLGQEINLFLAFIMGEDYEPTLEDISSEKYLFGCELIYFSLFCDGANKAGWTNGFFYYLLHGEDAMEKVENRAVEAAEEANMSFGTWLNLKRAKEALR